MPATPSNRPPTPRPAQEQLALNAGSWQRLKACNPSTVTMGTAFHLGNASFRLLQSFPPGQSGETLQQKVMMMARLVLARKPW